MTTYRSAPLRMLLGRNIKLYFKDKVTFFTSLLTPLILLVLFVTFLKSVYISSFTSMLPAGFTVEDNILNAFTGGWLMSSILGVSSVTVAFCSNIIMVQDKITGAVTDFLVTPIRKSVLALGYYLSNLLTTLLVCIIAMTAGFLYLAAVGWYLSVTDILLIISDIVLCVLFGTSLAAIAESFLSTQGGISAVATMVSSMYGFVCGAYMPISQFAEPIRNFVVFIPGTYGTVLLRNHYMNGCLDALNGKLPTPLLEGIRNGFDGNLFFFGNKVEIWQMYAVLAGASLVLIAVYILLQYVRITKPKKK